MGVFADTCRMERWACKRASLWVASVTLCTFASIAAAEVRDSEASLADRIATSIYFEGVPFEEARDLSAADVARLIELLGDLEQTRNHPNIIVALGMSGSPEAFDAIADYALRGSSGEMDRLEYRAQRSIAFGMGHLARVDGRALAWLIRSSKQTHAAPQRSFRQMDSARIARMMRKGAITGLALSGQPAAERAIAEIIAAPGEEARIVEHANESLATHRKMHREGPASALRTGFEAE
jgi:hypothetical protein